MGQKTSKDRSKKGKEPSANEASTAQSKFAIYLLAKNDEATLLQAQVSVAAFGSNAVLLSPDFHNASSSSSGTRKYNTYVIVDGHWLPERDENGRRTSERKTKSINFNLSSAKLVAVQQDIQLISPNTPKYQNILNATLSFFGVQQLSQLEKLPDVIHQNIIAAQYDKKSFIVAKGLSTILHRMYKPAEKSIIARTLLEHVIRGEQKRAEDLLNKLVKTNPEIFPELFTLKIKVKDDAGREFEKTAYQLALGGKDVKYHDDEECMAEMLLRFIRDHKEMIPNGEMMLAKQCEEQFPAGWEDRESEREALDSVELQKILTVLDEISESECQAIHHVDDGIQDILRARNGKKQDAELKELDQAVLHADKDNFETAFNQLRNYLEKNGIVQNDAFRFDALKALYQFRNYLELQTKESMKYSFHFNENLLINALKLYDDNYRRFGDRWDSAKNLVSWRKIIGYTQRFVPACLAQTIHQGVYYIVQDRETLRRQTHFKYDSAFKLLPVDPLSPSLPGYDFAAVAGAWSGFDAARAGYRPCLAFTKLMSSKNINVAKLTQQPGSQSKKIPAMK